MYTVPETWVIDPHRITDDQRARLLNELTEPEAVTLSMVLAVHEALATAAPSSTRAHEIESVYAPSPMPVPLPLHTPTREIRYIDAITEALQIAMRRDSISASGVATCTVSGPATWGVTADRSSVMRAA